MGKASAPESRFHTSTDMANELCHPNDGDFLTNAIIRSVHIQSYEVYLPFPQALFGK